MNLSRTSLISVATAFVVIFLASGIGNFAISQDPNETDVAQKVETSQAEHTNRLAGETSPYLLLHAHNPVDWYPWGEEALKKARDENKVIFLSIG